MEFGKRIHTTKECYRVHFLLLYHYTKSDGMQLNLRLYNTVSVTVAVYVLA